MVYSALKDLFIGPNAYRTYWYAFLIAFPFSWRNVIIPSILGGPFNEFMDFSVYIGDILILSSFVLLLRHRSVAKSIIAWLSRFHVEHVALLLLVAYFITSLLGGSSPILLTDAVWGYVRVIVIATVFYYAMTDRNSAGSTWNTQLFTVALLAIGMLAQSLIGICQFIVNGSLGIRVLGESILSTSIPGVAEVKFGESVRIRAYGTFLHPNVFGGYIVVLVLLFVGFIRLFHAKQLLRYIELFHVKQFLVTLIALLPMTALILSLSKSAIFALLIVGTVYLFHVERNTQRRTFRVERIVLIIGLMAVLVIVAVQGMDGIGQSISERLDRYISARSAFIDNQWLGLGPGNTVFSQSIRTDYEQWMLQPVHNAYLLLLFEYGYLGFAILIALVIAIAAKVPHGTNSSCWLPLIALASICVFDHYVLTLYVGNVLVGIAIGWLFANESIDRSINKCSSYNIQRTLHT